MEHVISFPGMGIEEFTLNRVVTTLFGQPIYWYGVIIAMAFLAGICYVITRCHAFGLDSDRVLDVLLVAVIGAIVGARLYYVVFSWDQYKDQFWSIFNFREGGLAIYGGIIAGFLVGYIMCRKRKVRFLPMADVTVCGIIIGQAIGRWGNFMNIEAFGSVTELPWRMCSPVIANYLTWQGQIDPEGAQRILDGSLGVHPTFFYESAWCLLGFLLVLVYTKHRRFDGELVLLYMLWYGTERAVIEGIRTDSLMVGDYRVSQLLSIALALIALLLLVRNYRRIRRSRNPEECMLYVHSGESREMLAQVAQERQDKKAKGFIAPLADEASDTANDMVDETVNDAKEGDSDESKAD